MAGQDGFSHDNRGMTSHPILITKSDDLGCFSAANRAIFHAVRHGICRNVGLMAGAPAAAEGARLLGSDPTVCLGLHAALTCEWENWRWGPVLPRQRVPSIVDPDGTLPREPARHHDGKSSLDEMEAEIRAQVARARELGANLRYLDAHMGFDWVHEQPTSPRFQERMGRIAREEGLIWLHSVIDGPEKGRSFAIHPDGRRVEIGHLPHSKSGHALDHALEGLQKYSFELPAILTRHPVDPDAESRSIHLRNRAPGEDAQGRYWEWQSFVDPRILELVAKRNIRVVRLDELFAK